jgi:hypothetical protein
MILFLNKLTTGELSYIMMPDLSNGQRNSFRPHGFGLTEHDTTELEGTGILFF